MSCPRVTVVRVIFSNI